MCFRCRARDLCEEIDHVLAAGDLVSDAENVADLLRSARDCISTYRTAEIALHQVLTGEARVEAIIPDQAQQRH